MISPIYQGTIGSALQAANAIKPAQDLQAAFQALGMVMPGIPLQPNKPKPSKAPVSTAPSAQRPMVPPVPNISFVDPNDQLQQAISALSSTYNQDVLNLGKRRDERVKAAQGGMEQAKTRVDSLQSRYDETGKAISSTPRPAMKEAGKKDLTAALVLGLLEAIGGGDGQATLGAVSGFMNGRQQRLAQDTQAYDQQLNQLRMQQMGIGDQINAANRQYGFGLDEVQQAESDFLRGEASARVRESQGKNEAGEKYRRDSNAQIKMAQEANDIYAKSTDPKRAPRSKQAIIQGLNQARILWAQSGSQNIPDDKELIRMADDVYGQALSEELQSRFQRALAPGMSTQQQNLAKAKLLYDLEREDPGLLKDPQFMNAIRGYGVQTAKEANEELKLKFANSTFNTRVAQEQAKLDVLKSQKTKNDAQAQKARTSSSSSDPTKQQRMRLATLKAQYQGKQNEYKRLIKAFDMGNGYMRPGWNEDPNVKKLEAELQAIEGRLTSLDKEASAPPASTDPFKAAGGKIIK